MVKRSHAAYLLFFLLLAVLRAPCDAAAAGQSPKEVLLLTSYHQGDRWNDSVVQGVREALGSLESVSLSIENLDMRRYTDLNHLRMTTEYIRAKYQGRPQDLVLVSDDPALNFLITLREELFPNTPVVFCGVNNFTPKRIQGQSNITGINEALSLEATLELALKLFPQTSQIMAVVSDTEANGRTNREQYQAAAARIKSRIQFDELLNMTGENAPDILSRLPKDTLVLRLIDLLKPEGGYVSIQDSIRILSTHAPVPVFTLWSFDLGVGALGGYVSSGQAQGRAAGNLAIRILEGQEADQIPVVMDSPNVPMFDYNVMKRFGIKDSALPRGSVVINRHDSLWEQYWFWLLGIVLFCGVQTFLILALLTRGKRLHEANAALRDSEVQFRAMVETIPMAIHLTTGVEQITQYVNPTMVKLFGYTQEDIPSVAQWWPLAYPDASYRKQVAEEWTRRVQRAIDTQSTIEPMEVVCTCKDGSKKNISWNYITLGDKNYSCGLDITERKQAEAELQRSEEKFRDIITTVREGILSLDADWCITFANAHLAKMLGYDLDELLGQSFEVFLHDEDREDFARRKHERQQGQNSQFERRFKTKDGGEIWTIVSASAFKDDKGDFAGSFGTITDITERKRAEDVLQASERRAIAQRMALSQLALHPAFVEGDTSRAFQVVAKSIAETLDVARTSVWILEEDGSELRCHTLYQSDSKAFSSGAELNASTLPRYFAAIMAENRIYAEDAQNDPRTSEMAEDYLKPLGITSLLDSGIVIEGCLRGVVCSEHVGHMRKWHPDEEGFISTVSAMIAQLYVNAAIKRVEEEKSQLENKIHQSRKMEAIGQLAGGVAHDFNNMLGVIIGYSELILEQMDPSQQFHANLVEIEKAARRSADLTRQLLTFARKQTVTPRVLDLNQTIEGMLNMLRRLIGENISLSWMPGFGLWPIHMDPSQIDQILANLCVNARDAIAGVGKLTVETKNDRFDKEYCATHVGSLPGDYVRISVSDTGSGMDKETLAHIFEPFFTTKEVGEGTGLGLATVYGAVKQNNGFIYVYSEPGQGTTFTIYIPRHVETTTETQVTASPKPVVRGDEIVMLVEDEPTLLGMSKMMLERLGYTVMAAGNPREAMRLASEYAGEIHLLATDVIMPEMNGRELSVRLLESRPEMKCLFMSGYAASIIANQGVLKKGVPFIQKPFSMKDLGGKLREVLEG